jgi:uncharacterized protein (TIGR02246 family)
MERAFQTQICEGETRVTLTKAHIVTLAAWRVVLIGIACSLLLAQETEFGDADRAAIEAIGQRWQQAWNRRDAEGLSNLVSQDVDFVTVLGPDGWLKGRERFYSVHARMFTTLFVESVWTNNETHLKRLRSDLAIMRVLWETKGDKVRHIRHGAPRAGIFTWVLEKRGGKWIIVAAQNTERIPPLPGQ